jgi:hypothetical protein
VQHERQIESEVMTGRRGRGTYLTDSARQTR